MGMQAFALHELHDQVDVLGRVDRLDQSDNVLVVEPAQNSYLSDSLLLPMDVH